MSDNDEIIRRLDRLEDGLALLLVERYSGPMTDVGELRRSVKGEMGELGREVQERLQGRLEDSTPVCQYTGINVDELRAFVGADASVAADPSSRTVVWFVRDGRSERVSPGQWFARDPSTDRVYLAEPPTLREAR